MPRETVGTVCKTHGYVAGAYCNKCERAPVRDKTTGIITHQWVTQGTWENIDPKNPHLRVSSKQELLKHCERTGNYARAFMKPRSQGKGFEHKRRGV